MQPISFPGAVEIKKPADMTDEQCMSIWSKYGYAGLMRIIEYGQVPPPLLKEIDQDKFPYFLTAWKPSYEDLQALNRGEPIYIKTLSAGLPPMSLFTLNEKGEGNF
jgi:hypothetical protein